MNTFSRIQKSPYRALKLVSSAVLAAGLIAFPMSSALADTQAGGPSVYLNYGGGGAADGSNGLQAVFNSKSGQTIPNNTAGWGPTTWSNGAEWLVWADAYNFNTVLANLAIGSTAFSSGAFGGSYTEWSSVTVDEVSGVVAEAPNGSTTPPSGTETGDASFHIRYTATSNSLDYFVDRYVSYTYPNSFWDERIVVTIPTGNTDTVAYWFGGDTSPGESDSAYGMSTSLPLYSLYSYVPASNVYVSFQELTEDSPFDGGRAAGLANLSNDFGVSTPDGFDIVQSLNDAGTTAQFAFGSTPGAYERSMRVMVGFGGPQVQVSLDKTEMTTTDTATLHVNLINFKDTDSTGMGFTLPLPAGLTLAGPIDFGECVASSTSAAGATSLAVTGIDLDAFGSCYLEVPISGAAGDYVILESDVTGSGGLQSGYNESPLVITGSSLPDTGLDATLVTMIALGCFATGVGILMRRRRRA